MNTQLWSRPATIERNNFLHKSLSCWSYNIAVGCEHACRFCYVPEVSTNRMATKLEKFGVKDPDAEWGDYVFLRKWDEHSFRLSLANANAEMLAHQLTGQGLNADGNHAVMLCTTTDPYQVGGSALALRDGDLTIKEFQDHRRQIVRRALQLILEESTLNVRILTRSPLAREDFDLMKQFGKRLLFGMSIPTLNNQLAKIYEPKAPAPTQRLATLQAAKAAGLNVFVAVAPVYPECDAADMNATLRAVRELHPVTVFMEPINIRADNVARIEAHAKELGETLKTEVFATPERWRNYAVDQMTTFAAIALSLDIPESVIHLWPDKSLGSKDALRQFMPPSHNFAERQRYDVWLNHHWNKISAWPK